MFESYFDNLLCGINAIICGERVGYYPILRDKSPVLQ